MLWFPSSLCYNDLSRVSRLDVLQPSQERGVGRTWWILRELLALGWNQQNFTSLWTRTYHCLKVTTGGSSTEKIAPLSSKQKALSITSTDSEEGGTPIFKIVMVIAPSTNCSLSSRNLSRVSHIKIPAPSRRRATVHNDWPCLECPRAWKPLDGECPPIPHQRFQFGFYFLFENKNL